MRHLLIISVIFISANAFSEELTEGKKYVRYSYFARKTKLASFKKTVLCLPEKTTKEECFAKLEEFEEKVSKMPRDGFVLKSYCESVDSSDDCERWYGSGVDLVEAVVLHN
ncbi:MAG: hypothetical protein HOE90_14800 [Bacteriovoracaceae bacterium]|jgi:hypothetical protein|nr:hypothetical protein [Bacteriovoracaceae bacterium]